MPENHCKYHYKGTICKKESKARLKLMGKEIPVCQEHKARFINYLNLAFISDVPGKKNNDNLDTAYVATPSEIQLSPGSFVPVTSNTTTWGFRRIFVARFDSFDSIPMEYHGQGFSVTCEGENENPWAVYREDWARAVESR